MPARKKINPNNLDAADIRNAMKARWTAPEWAIMWEVANSTGSSARRSADAVMMSLWPSRGLELHGVEIKVSRSDWKREARDPTKAETIAKFCDRWWVHTPVGVVDDLSDMPPAWGLREYSGKQWRTVKEAEKTDAEVMDRGFLAALLRRSDESMQEFARRSLQSERDAMANHFQKEREQFRETVDKTVKRRTSESEIYKEQIEAFESAAGVPISKYLTDMALVGRCAMHLSQLVELGYSGLEKKADQFEQTAATFRELAELTKKESE